MAKIQTRLAAITVRIYLRLPVDDDGIEFDRAVDRGMQSVTEAIIDRTNMVIPKDESIDYFRIQQDDPTFEEPEEVEVEDEE